MISKEDLDEILGYVKKYIDSIFEGYSATEKTLAAFEQENMQLFVGDSRIDGVFRQFLRSFQNTISNADIKDISRRVTELEKETRHIKCESLEIDQQLEAQSVIAASTVVGAQERTKYEARIEEGKLILTKKTYPNFGESNSTQAIIDAEQLDKLLKMLGDTAYEANVTTLNFVIPKGSTDLSHGNLTIATLTPSDVVKLKALI